TTGVDERYPHLRERSLCPVRLQVLLERTLGQGLQRRRTLSAQAGLVLAHQPHDLLCRVWREPSLPKDLKRMDALLIAADQPVEDIVVQLRAPYVTKHAPRLLAICEGPTQRCCSALTGYQAPEAVICEMAKWIGDL